MFMFENTENTGGFLFVCVGGGGGVGFFFVLFFSRVEDAALLLITIKLFQWEFGPPGGS